jgi:amino acid adenylation domain-containing protein
MATEIAISGALHAVRETNLCVHQVFEAQVAKTPENVAVALGTRRLSYRQLNERANQVAHYLRKLGVGPDVFVGICLDRTPDLVVGLLGILKAGGTYVPIDPQYPRERLTFMLTDSQSPVFLTQKSLAANLDLANTRTVLLDEDWEAIAREPNTNPPSDVRADNLAYVIYTSGSTGKPKGTLISHRNVVRLFTSTHHWFRFDEHDVWTLFHSCAFDFSVWELWGALFYGGRLVVVPFDVSRTPDSFYRLLHDERVTVLNQTPSAFRQLVRAEQLAELKLPLALRFVIFGGEALDFKSLEPWFARHGDAKPRLVNMYGITETTVHVTYRPISLNDLGGSSVIGVPIPDLQIHLLDEQRNPVEVGTPGEIYVGGAGVARGYLNRPELNAQKFVPDSTSTAAAARLYRSGDLARYLPNGDLEYLGRIDSQVKIRGFRIELGEIAAAINAHPAVRDSVVIVGELQPGEKSLLAYLVKASDEEVDLTVLRQLLRSRLPEYMVPSEFTFIAEIPLTVNGKLDVKALPEPRRQRPSGPPQPTGGSALEQGIAEIWRDVLQQSSVGLEQNFFDVGGNSMNLVQVHARLQRLLGREFSVTELFTHSTVRALANHFAAQKSSGTADAAAQRAQRQRDALAAQRALHRARK